MNSKTEMPHPVRDQISGLPHLHSLIVPPKIERTEWGACRANHYQVGLVLVQEVDGLLPLGWVVEIPGLPVIRVIFSKVKSPKGFQAELCRYCQYRERVDLGNHRRHVLPGTYGAGFGGRPPAGFFLRP